MSVSSTNSWLRAQRKSDLVDVAESVGLKNYEQLKKIELEAALDDHLAEHAAKYSNKSEVAGYYNSRSKALGSPVKKESTKDEAEKALKVTKRRATKAAEEVAAEVDSSARSAAATSTALVQTPGRSLSRVAARIPLPTTPADVASVVDRSAVAVRQRVASVYHETGVDEVTQVTRETLSTVQSIVVLISFFEMYYIRSEVLPNRYAFTIPAVSLLGSPDYPVYLPDMFLLLTASFWSPALTWVFTSFIVPSVFGYFFNLNATSTSPGPRTRSKAHAQEYPIDPLTFSIVKALVSYVVYAQGVTFSGLLSELAIERLNSAVYGGYKGILTGTAISGLFSIYDAVLKK